MKFNFGIYQKLLVSSAFCLLLLMTRILKTETFYYTFLVWNLFLAFAPLLWIEFVSRIIRTKSLLRQFILFFGWLMLFPNAPYVFTDLMHLKGGSNAPVWFDVLLILSFSMTSIVAGFLSLNRIIGEFQTGFSKQQLNIAISIIFFLTSFGIYLGRFLRFNSWDVLNRPMHIFSEVLDRFIHPMEYSTTWGMTLVIGGFLHIFYWFFQLNEIEVRNGK